jgi:prepilin peptidase CpaA
MHSKLWEMIASTGSWVVLLFILAVSIVTDVKYKKIFNGVTLPGIMLGLLFGLLAGFPDAFFNRLIGLTLGFAVFFILFLSGYMGGGDVKLVAAIGALTGYPFIVDAIFFGILAGGLYAVVFMLVKKRFLENMTSIFRFILSIINPWRQTHSLKREDSLKIPYGVCISVGTLIAFFIHQTTSAKCYFLGY